MGIEHPLMIPWVIYRVMVPMVDKDRRNELIFYLKNKGLEPGEDFIEEIYERVPCIVIDHAIGNLYHMIYETLHKLSGEPPKLFVITDFLDHEEKFMFYLKVEGFDYSPVILKNLYKQVGEIG